MKRTQVKFKARTDIVLDAAGPLEMQVENC